MRQKNSPANAGAALVLTLCAAALLLSLAAALVYGASVLLASASRPLEEERLYQQAKTFSEVVGEELTAKPAEDNTPANRLQGFVNDFVVNAGGLQYQNDQDYTLVDQSSAGQNEHYGAISLTFRKEEVEDFEPAASFAGKESMEQCAQLEKKEPQYTDWEVKITVTVAQEEKSDRYARTYLHKAAYTPHYYYRDAEIYRSDDNTDWYADAAQTNRVNVGPEEKIQVRYSREGTDARVYYTQKGSPDETAGSATE